MPEDKLLHSVHRFLSRPSLGIGKTFEETGIRYTAFVCFLFSFLIVSLHFQSSTHTKYLTDKSFTKSQRNKDFGPRGGLGHLLGALGASGFIRAPLQPVRAPPPSPTWVGGEWSRWKLGATALHSSSRWLPEVARAEGGPHTGRISRPPLHRRGRICPTGHRTSGPLGVSVLLPIFLPHT